MGAFLSSILETPRFKSRRTAENLVAVSRGVAKRLELSTVPREEFPKVTIATRDEAGNMVGAGNLLDEADGRKSTSQSATDHHAGCRDALL